MREILFKAKAINRDKGYHRTNYKNGDWVYGLITRLYDERFENLPAEMTDENGVSGIEIDHNTICQYTGLTDRNGNKIYENDKVYIRYTDGQSEMDDVVQVRYQNGCFTPWIWQYECDGCDLRCELLEIEVIGNIFDNSELIGEQNG